MVGLLARGRIDPLVHNGIVDREDPLARKAGEPGEVVGEIAPHGHDLVCARIIAVHERRHDAMPRMRLAGWKMLGRRGPFGQHQAGRHRSEIARPDRAQVRPELGRDENVRSIATEIGNEAGQTRQHSAETLLPGEQHRPCENAEAPRVGPHNRKAGHETRLRIENDHARTCR